MRKAVVLLVLLLLPATVGGEAELPVRVPAGLPTAARIRNPAPLTDLHARITGPSEDGKGLAFDLGDESLSGTVYSGPYPFEEGEADYDYARYRFSGKVEKGKGAIPVSGFLRDVYNANGWPAGQSAFPATPAVAYRLHLHRNDGKKVTELGFYDGVVNVRFEKGKVFPNLTILEGPFVTGMTSERPDRVTIVWRTDRPAAAFLRWSKPFDPVAPRPEKLELPNIANYIQTRVPGRNLVTLEGLEPGRRYWYQAESHGVADGDEEKVVSSVYSFVTPPKRGEGEVCFAFGSDSREGIGGGERQHMGVNFHVASAVARDAYRRGADLAIFGGDLVNGYTSDVGDFRLQLRTWKKAWAGFWRNRPVYPAMGNHETLVNAFRTMEGKVLLDKWPYGSRSAEAIFAAEFENPRNGPDPSDFRRPTYMENVYSFPWGPVLFVAFNNNYWWTTNGKVSEYGGSPEGYMLDDQLTWIEETLAGAAKDETVKFVVLYAQEPIFPAGGHLGDAMWWGGDNNVRAHHVKDGKLVPAGPGILEVRNRFWRAVARCQKSAAVLVGDEHAYVRLKIDATTPVGVPSKDDTDGDGKLDRTSPNPEFTHAVWQITAGNGGAPHYCRQPTPWDVAKFSSQPGYCLFRTDGEKLSMTAYTTTGQAMDRVDDLMAIKR
ncbi:MAG: metallophosphoesterase [Planctomycetota bacterium]